METQAFFGHVSTLGCLPVRTKTFSTHVEAQNAMTCVNLAFSRTRKLNEVRPGQVTEIRGDARNGK